MRKFAPIIFIVTLIAGSVLFAQNAQQGGQGNAPFSCTITMSTATTTQCQPAPGTGFRNYIQSYQIFTTAAGTTNTITIEGGTGTNCASNVTVLTPAYPPTTISPANSPGVLVTLGGSGLVPPTADALCAVQSATAGTATITITGYVGP